MLISLPESGGDLACVKIVGKLTAEDYQALMEIFHGILNRHGVLRLYANLEEFDGWEWQASWDKVAFGIKHWGKIMQIAMVGTDRWAHLGAQLAGNIKSADVQYFEPTDNAQALAWVQDHQVRVENSSQLS